MFADGGVWFLWLGLGLVLVAVLLLIIVLVEALILWGLKWGSFTRSFIDSLVINLTSAAFGLVFIVVFSAFSSSYRVGAFLVFFILTVLIEGGVLTLLKRHPRRTTWVAAIAINVASYALLYVLLGLFGQI